jgi:hypothetical protein
MSSDAIVLLKADLQQIRGLFREFQAAGGKAIKKKAKGARQIIGPLTVHTCIENKVTYPEVGKLLPELGEDVPGSYEERHVAGLLCVELSGMPADGERFDAKTTVLIENVTHHIGEEEQDWFPKARAGLWPSAASGTRNLTRAGPGQGAQDTSPPQRAEKDDRRRHLLTGSRQRCSRVILAGSTRANRKSCHPLARRWPAGAGDTRSSLVQGLFQLGFTHVRPALDASFTSFLVQFLLRCFPLARRLALRLNGFGLVRGTARVRFAGPGAAGRRPGIRRGACG